MSASDEMTKAPVSADLLALLRCPVCRGSLVKRENSYSCPSCGREFPEVRGVVRFVDEGNYADSFGYQWQRFQRTQLDHAARNLSEVDFARKTGLKPEDLKGKLDRHENVKVVETLAPERYREAHIPKRPCVRELHGIPHHEPARRRIREERP